MQQGKCVFEGLENLTFSQLQQRFYSLSTMGTLLLGAACGVGDALIFT
jgi:hypothetical protein